MMSKEIPTLEKAIEREYANDTTPSYKTKRRFGLNAFKRGWQDAANGNCSPDDNPYPDLRTDNGSVTFSRAYRRAWLRGYTAYHKMWSEYDPGYHLP
jgi:hypothetical protein